MWTLKNERTGVEKSFEDWGIESPQLQHVSLDTGRLTANLPDYATADVPFQHKDKLTIYRDREYDAETEVFSGGTRHFVGVFQHPSSILHESEEGADIEAFDPWWYLEKIRFERVGKKFQGWEDDLPGTTPILIDVSTTNVVLNQENNGTILNTRDELANILDWAIARGAPIQYVKADLPSQKIPPRSELDISCADAVRRQIAYMNAVQWWDYSVAGHPKFCMKRRSDCVEVDLNIAPVAGVQRIQVGQITRRDDLLVPYVKINFEKEYSDSGGSFTQVITYQHPDPIPNDHIGPLIATVRLAPQTGLTIQQEIDVIDLDPTSLDFWKVFKPELNTPLEYHDLEIVAGSASVTGSLALPRALLTGDVQPWMEVATEDRKSTRLNSSHRT